MVETKSEKMKALALKRMCPKCGRKNALVFFPGAFVCRWCKAEFPVQCQLVGSGKTMDDIKK